MRAMFKYQATQSDELSFEEGDTLYILDTSDPNGWWKAKCNNKVGLIPSNYGKYMFTDYIFVQHCNVKWYVKPTIL